MLVKRLIHTCSVVTQTLLLLYIHVHVHPPCKASNPSSFSMVFIKTGFWSRTRHQKLASGYVWQNTPLIRWVSCAYLGAEILRGSPLVQARCGHAGRRRGFWSPSWWASNTLEYRYKWLPENKLTIMFIDHHLRIRIQQASYRDLVFIFIYEHVDNLAERSSLPDSSSGVSNRMWVRIPAVTLVSLSKTLNHNCFSPPRG